jgi:hypothetical protein
MKLTTVTEQQEERKMTYTEYKPAETKAHNTHDKVIIDALANYLLKHSPEQLLRCVASAAIDTQGRNGENDDAALGWLAWKANDVASGEL